MAEQHQVNLLKLGHIAWNKYRAANPTEPVDLRGVKIDKAELLVADLIRADLTEPVNENRTHDFEV